jgi:hypothetical protein
VINIHQHYGDQREQVFYLITGVTDIRTDKVYNLQEGIQQKLFDHKKGVYINPITADEINIGEAVKRGFIQVQAVSSQIIFNNTDQILTDKRRAIISQEPYGNTNDSRSKLSIRIESQSRPRTPYEINESEILQREKDVVEIESVQRLPRHKKQHCTTREEEIIEKHTTNIIDRDVFISRNENNRAKSNEREQNLISKKIDIHHIEKLLLKVIDMYHHLQKINLLLMVHNVNMRSVLFLQLVLTPLHHHHDQFILMIVNVKVNGYIMVNSLSMIINGHMHHHHQLIQQ